MKLLKLIFMSSEINRNLWKSNKMESSSFFGSAEDKPYWELWNGMICKRFGRNAFFSPKNVYLTFFYSGQGKWTIVSSLGPHTAPLYLCSPHPSFSLNLHLFTSHLFVLFLFLFVYPHHLSFKYLLPSPVISFSSSHPLLPVLFWPYFLLPFLCSPPIHAPKNFFVTFLHSSIHSSEMILLLVRFPAVQHSWPCQVQLIIVSWRVPSLSARLMRAQRQRSPQ